MTAEPKAADDHQNRLVGMKTAELPCCLFISVQQFFADRGSVRILFSAGSDFKVSRKLQQTFRATGIQSLLASPGVISDSWITHGIFREAAARTTGTDTNPPLEKQRPAAALLKFYGLRKIP